MRQVFLDAWGGGLRFQQFWFHELLFYEGRAQKSEQKGVECESSVQVSDRGDWGDRGDGSLLHGLHKEGILAVWQFSKRDKDKGHFWDFDAHF